MGMPIEILAEAGDGQEGIARAVALNPDVVLMDLEMPEMDGYTATRAIKGCCPATRVIVLSVHGDPLARLNAVV